MMQEEAIVQALTITKIGQRLQFQMLLPKDTHRIVGFEYGVIKTNGIVLSMIPFNNASLGIIANKPIGRLTLQVPGVEGIFVQEDLMEERNTLYGDVVTGILWYPFHYSHGSKRHELSLSVQGKSKFIEGYYADSWGVNEYQSLEYTVHLYLWIEKIVL